MKKTICILLVILLTASFLTGCGGKDRELFKKTDLSKYVEISDYMGIEINTESDEFISYYESIVVSEIQENNFYNDAVYEGTVKIGDKANIDYVGKKDGVAFEGGSAEGYDLTIGSGTFIDDFEEELIGVSVGETVDVTATFPEDYGSEELAGADAIFTVTVNYITPAQTPEEFYSEMGYDSLEEYVADTKRVAAKNCIFNYLVENAVIDEYPEDDCEAYWNALKAYNDELCNAQYGIDYETLITQNGYTVEYYKQETINIRIPELMVMYYILDKENLEIDKEAIEEYNTKHTAMAEMEVVKGIVLDYLYNNAVIK